DSKSTVIEVLVDGGSGWRMLRWTFGSKLRRLAWRRFTRIRAKITIVSWTEKPITVRAAVTNRVLISPSVVKWPMIEKTPASTKTSWSRARMAQTANLKLKRKLR